MMARQFYGAPTPSITAPILSPNAGRHGARALNTIPVCFFQAYQKDPRTGFIKLFDRMSKIDALNQFTTHVGSAVFACPPGVQKGQYIGQRLFEA